MLEGIPLGITEIGPVGLLVIVVGVIFLGMYRRKLVPEKDLLDEQAEKQQWSTAYERSEEARREADKQDGELIDAVAKNNELGELTVAMLKALRSRADT